MHAASGLALAGAFAGGAATVFAFAPFGLSALPVVTLALLVLLWQRAPTPRAAAWSGFAFGLGLFGVGVPWVYIALNTFGGMAAPLAAIGTAGFCAFLALYPALVGWLTARMTEPESWPRALAAAALWTLAEWARSFVLTGFPWLSLGCAALPSGTSAPFAGYAPFGGVFLASFATALAAAALALATEALARPARMRGIALLASIGALAAGGMGLARIESTQPAGAPVAVSLVQGNVAQELKFDPDFRRTNDRIYADLVAASRGRLVVLPESAFPVFADEIPPPLIEFLMATAAERDGDILAGVFTTERPEAPGGRPRYYNSVVSLGSAATQLYRKRHLVPFGETIPLEPVLGFVIRTMLAIPLASQSAGEPDQPPLALAGQRVAVNICYEDAFGADIRSQAAAATLLVNVTNDAWYGRSLAAEQHNQIAAMRALETGRPLLRATNTGITSAIAHDGREIARLPWFTRGILEVEVAGRKGVTPYVRYGDAVPATLALAAFVTAFAAARRKRASPGR